MTRSGQDAVGVWVPRRSLAWCLSYYFFVMHSVCLLVHALMQLIALRSRRIDEGSIDILPATLERYVLYREYTIEVRICYIQMWDPVRSLYILLAIPNPGSSNMPPSGLLFPFPSSQPIRFRSRWQLLLVINVLSLDLHQTFKILPSLCLYFRARHSVIPILTIMDVKSYYTLYTQISYQIRLMLGCCGGGPRCPLIVSGHCQEASVVSGT